MKAPKDRTPSPTTPAGKGSGHDALMTPFPPNAREVASARPAARSSQSPLPKQTDGGQPRTNKGKSKSGKSGKGKGNASASGPVTHDTLLADVVRTLIAHEDEILALKFNHSFLMYASMTEQESIFSHLFQAQAACAQASMEEPPRIVIWKALMLEVMKHVEEAISCEKQDPASYAAALSLGLYRNFSRVRKSVCCLLKLQARSHMSGQMG